MISNSEYCSSVIRRAEIAIIAGVPLPVKVISREDLLLHKLYAGRVIDQADVAMLMRSHWQSMDQECVRQWVKRLELESEFNAALRVRE